jgi:hypothetical protein
MKPIATLFLLLMLTGCNLTDFALDPMGAIVNPDNSAKSSFNESNTNSTNSSSKSSLGDNNSKDINVGNSPTFYVAAINTYKFNNRFFVNINDLKSYDFSAKSIGLSATDSVSDLSSLITFKHSGLSKSETGRTLWYVTYNVNDGKGNEVKMDVGFPAYVTVDENNFYDYFDLSRYIQNGVEETGSRVYIRVFTQLKPKDKYLNLMVLESDLTVLHGLSFNWTQETFQGDPYNIMNNLRIDSKTYGDTIITQKIIENNTLIDQVKFSGDNYLQRSYRALQNTSFVVDWPPRTDVSQAKYNPSVSFEDILFTTDEFFIVGSMKVSLSG